MSILYKHQNLVFVVCRLITYLVISLLILILAVLLIKGGSVISWQFLTYSWNHSQIDQGGIFPALVGSFYIGIGVLIISFPLGFATALFLTEYAQNTIWKRIIQLSIRNLAGVPSVVYGLFGLALFVHALQFGTSLLSAILTLSIMSLPWVITAAVESFEAVPRSLLTSSLALGATKWQTMEKVILPVALPASITGGILAMARAMGETAPIIIVGATFYLSTLPTSIFDKYMALPYHTFILATQHSSPLASDYAAATALVLIMTTVFLSLGAIFTRYYLTSKKNN